MGNKQEKTVEENTNDLKIELYPTNKPRYKFETKPIKEFLPQDIVDHSLNSKQQLAFMDSNVPLLNGFYQAHTNHYPLRIKPDDIWLLIVQALSNHVNANSEELRHHFVNFDGKQKLTVNYSISNLKQVNKKMLEDFSEQINEQMKKFLGEELVNLLTPNFSTTTNDTKIVGKISIMGAFKKYFEYQMNLCGCGMPYIILEGTADDYKEIISKAKQLSKYEFDWYINRILPHIEKMVEAKEGKIDVDYFKNMIQKREQTEKVWGLSGIYRGEFQFDYISGWILDFFAYLNTKDMIGRVDRFESKEVKVNRFKDFANQMLVVPFNLTDASGNEHSLKYKVGFFGCEQNKKKEVSPVQGWFVSPLTDEDKNAL